MTLEYKVRNRFLGARTLQFLWAMRTSKSDRKIISVEVDVPREGSIDVEAIREHLNLKD